MYILYGYAFKYFYILLHVYYLFSLYQNYLEKDSP